MLYKSSEQTTINNNEVESIKMADDMNNQEALSNWVREQFQRAGKHLAEQGILFDTVAMEESRYLAPEVAIWKIKDTNKNFYWVISGDLPADAVNASVAKTAREAVNHFSLSWQLKAEKINNHAASDNAQKEYAKLLMTKAEMLYEMQSQDQWWQ